MFRSADLVLSRSVRFTADLDVALARLREPRGLELMFASYGSLSHHASALADTLAARPVDRVSVDMGEIAGECPDGKAWARALASALDALDDPAPSTALMEPFAAPNEATEVDKIRQLRAAADLGVSDARALLRDRDGDLAAALAAIEAGKSPEQIARDRAGAFVAGLVRPQRLPDRRPWQVLFEASALDYGVRFPPADLLLQSSVPDDLDLRTFDRLLGEGAAVGGVSWEPNFR